MSVYVARSGTGVSTFTNFDVFAVLPSAVPRWAGLSGEGRDFYVFAFNRIKPSKR